jgi:uracil-DNA glycosylase family 4
VDARDRLRRYLEQRRELGESEFVLDGLAVDDVLRLVGALTAGTARGRGESPAAPRPPRAATPDVAPSSAPPVYEQVLPAPPSAPAPQPERRFSEHASTDWREALRNAGAGRPGGVGAAPAGLGGNAPAPTEPPAQPPQSSSVPAARESVLASAAIVLPPWLETLGIPAGLEAGRLRVTEIAPDVAMLPTLDDVAAHIAACTSCALYKGAKHPVPGEGNSQAELLCVGEAPGAHEDEQGRPFVGEAGQLLTKILGAIQLSRDEVYICNVLKHRPPGNRDPLPDEVIACQPYLLRQIELVRPKVILALGRFAAQTLLQTTTGIGALRGRIHRYHGVPLIVTYHPAALLRNESWKRPTWEDVKLARLVLDAMRAADRGTE